MEGKQSRVRHAFDDGRLSTAFRRIVAKMPFLDLHGRQDSLNLCRRCEGLNSFGIFKTPGPPQDRLLVLTLGIHHEHSPCALCRFLYSMRPSSIFDSTTNLYHLRKYHVEEYYNLGPCWELINSMVWTVNPGRESQYSKRDGDTRLYRHMSARPQLSFISQSTKSFPHPEATLKGLPVYETSVNYPLLRYWIKECEGHPNCSYLSTDSTKSHIGPTIRVIDCTTRHIVDLQPGDRYIALSYVWGKQPLLENTGNWVLPTNAPKVIEDAMVVVKELGQQYLWVDQYCINQHDDQDKHAQIKNMDCIYEGSYATIVAFSGDDSSSGLPGESGTPRMPQHRFASSKVTLLGFTPSITRQSLQASVWMKRGWTFQETLLSRRLLIFTQEQVYFSCSRGWWVESCAPRRRMLGEDDTTNGFSSVLAEASMNLISPLTKMPVDKSGYQLQVEISHLLDLIKKFTRRQLSFQSDALDAIRGLLSRVQVLTYWGIPVYDFLKKDKGVSAFDAWEANTVFLRCLFWQPDGTATDAEYFGRREGFPSWSWLGWRVPVTFPYHSRSEITCSTFKVENTDGTLLSISDLFKQFGAEVERSRILPEGTAYLWLEGLVFTLGFQPGSSSSRHDGGVRFCIDHALGYLDSPCLGAEGSCAPKSEITRAEVSFRLDVMGSEEIWRTTLIREWSCLWIYCSYRDHHFLILDEGYDAAYCVGTLCLWDLTVDGDLLEELKTKVPHEYRKVRIR